MTLEDTLLGSLADGLSWCGEPGSPGETRGVRGGPGAGQGAGASHLVSAPTGDPGTLKDNSGGWKTASCRPSHIF